MAIGKRENGGCWEVAGGGTARVATLGKTQHLVNERRRAAGRSERFVSDAKTPAAYRRQVPSPVRQNRQKRTRRFRGSRGIRNRFPRGLPAVRRRVTSNVNNREQLEAILPRTGTSCGVTPKRTTQWVACPRSRRQNNFCKISRKNQPFRPASSKREKSSSSGAGIAPSPSRLSSAR